jgi:hypothetical protein
LHPVTSLFDTSVYNPFALPAKCDQLFGSGYYTEGDQICQTYVLIRHSFCFVVLSERNALLGPGAAIFFWKNTGTYLCPAGPDRPKKAQPAIIAWSKPALVG